MPNSKYGTRHSARRVTTARTPTLMSPSAATVQTNIQFVVAATHRSRKTVTQINPASGNEAINIAVRLFIDLTSPDWAILARDHFNLRKAAMLVERDAH